MKHIFNLISGGKSAVLDIIGEIGFSFWGDSVSASSVRAQLGVLDPGGTLRVNIDSPGGSVSDAISIYNIIRERAAAQTSIEVHVQGIAASAASYIAMAADPGKLHMPSNTLLMIHKPWLYTAGNADDLRHDADTLDTFEKALIPAYTRHWERTEDELRAALEAETWLTADEAEEMFGAVVSGDPVQIAAKVDLSRFANVPQAALAFAEAASEPGDPPADPPADPPEESPEVADLKATIAEMQAKVDAATEEAARSEAVIAQMETDAAALTADLTNARAELETQNQAVIDARAELERVAGPGSYQQDHEATASTSWKDALARCNNDYVQARTKYPAAFKAFRASCSRR